MLLSSVLKPRALIAQSFEFSWATSRLSASRSASGRSDAAEAAMSVVAYGHKTFIPLASPVWSALSMHSRLSDVVVFDAD